MKSILVALLLLSVALAGGYMRSNRLYVKPGARNYFNFACGYSYRGTPAPYTEVYTYRFSGVPSWLTVSGSSLYGTPPLTMSGNFPIDVSYSGPSTSGTQYFVLSLGNPSLPSTAPWVNSYFPYVQGTYSTPTVFTASTSPTYTVFIPYLTTPSIPTTVVNAVPNTPVTITTNSPYSTSPTSVTTVTFPSSTSTTTTTTSTSSSSPSTSYSTPVTTYPVTSSSYTSSSSTNTEYSSSSSTSSSGASPDFSKIAEQIRSEARLSSSSTPKSQTPDFSKIANQIRSESRSTSSSSSSGGSPPDFSKIADQIRKESKPSQNDFSNLVNTIKNTPSRPSVADDSSHQQRPRSRGSLSSRTSTSFSEPHESSSSSKSKRKGRGGMSTTTTTLKVSQGIELPKTDPSLLQPFKVPPAPPVIPSNPAPVVTTVPTTTTTTVVVYTYATWKCNESPNYIGSGAITAVSPQYYTIGGRNIYYTGCTSSRPYRINDKVKYSCYWDGRQYWANKLDCMSC